MESPSLIYKKKRVGEALNPYNRFEVEKVLNIAFDDDGRQLFLIKWRGYGDSYNTWEPRENILCEDKLDEYIARVGEDALIPTPQNLLTRQRRERRTMNIHVHEIRYNYAHSYSKGTSAEHRWSPKKVKNKSPAKSDEKKKRKGKGKRKRKRNRKRKGRKGKEKRERKRKEKERREKKR